MKIVKILIDFKNLTEYETIKGEKGEVTYRPAKTIENITIISALDEYERYGTVKIPDFQSEETDRISKSLKEISETINKSPSNIKLKEI